MRNVHSLPALTGRGPRGGGRDETSVRSGRDATRLVGEQLAVFDDFRVGSYARIAPELRMTNLNVLLAIAETLRHPHGKGVPLPAHDHAVFAVAPSRLELDTEYPDGRTRQQVSCERIATCQRSRNLQDRG